MSFLVLHQKLELIASNRNKMPFDFYESYMMHKAVSLHFFSAISSCRITLTRIAHCCGVGPRNMVRGRKFFLLIAERIFFRARNYDNVSQILKKEINFWPKLQKIV